MKDSDWEILYALYKKPNITKGCKYVVYDAAIPDQTTAADGERI